MPIREVWSQPVDGWIAFRKTQYKPHNIGVDAYLVGWYLLDSLIWRNLLASHVTQTFPAVDYKTGEVIAGSDDRSVVAE